MYRYLKWFATCSVLREEKLQLGEKVRVDMHGLLHVAMIF